MLTHLMNDRSCTVIHFTLDTIHFAVPDASDFISWGAFLNFWSKYYSHLVIRKPSSYICNDCYKLVTVLKYRQAKLKTCAAAAAYRSNGDNAYKLESESDEDEDYDTDDQEEELLKAANHVERARAQRLFLMH